MSENGHDEIKGYICMTPNCGKVSPNILDVCPLCGQKDWRAIVDRPQVETKENPEIDDLIDGFLGIKEEYLAFESEFTITKPGVSKSKFEIKGSSSSFQNDRTGAVSRIRIKDKENDWYIEKVVYTDTGAVIRDCDQKLTDHWGHGSAKESKPNSDE